ncbi:hypothetical protein JCM8202_000453 [Rhodotorula sphaerocarpa]
MEARRRSPLEQLPSELVTLIVAFASRDGHRRSVLQRLALVSHAFAGKPGALTYTLSIRLTLYDAARFLAALQRDSSPSRRAGAVRNLTLSYSAQDPAPSDEEEEKAPSGPVPLRLAAPILFYLDQLTSLELESDDALALLHAVLQHRPRAFGSLERLATSRVRWDLLVQVLCNAAPSLRQLRIEGLFFEDPNVSTEDDAATHVGAFETGPPPLALDLASFQLAASGQTIPAHLEYTPVPPLPPAPPPAPLLSLRTLSLHSFSATDGVFVALIDACRATLDSLCLTDLTRISRRALVAALRLLGSLSELELTACRFSPEREAGQPPPILPAQPTRIQPAVQRAPTLSRAPQSRAPPPPPPPPQPAAVPVASLGPPAVPNQLFQFPTVTTAPGVGGSVPPAPLTPLSQGSGPVAQTGPGGGTASAVAPTVAQGAPQPAAPLRVLPPQAVSLAASLMVVPGRGGWQGIGAAAAGGGGAPGGGGGGGAGNDDDHDLEQARVIHPSLELLEAGSASRHALRDPISRSVLQYPLDSLAAWCPFLHVLHVVETDQVLSANGVEAVLGRLPLERATLGYQKPSVPVEAVESGMKASRGRLDLVEIHVGYVEVVHRMRWSERELDALRAAAAPTGVLVSGEAYKPWHHDDPSAFFATY